MSGETMSRPVVSQTAFFLNLIGMLASVCGCDDRSPLLKNLRSDELDWKTYSNSLLGYSIIYPSVFKLDEYGEGNLLLRYGSGVPVLVLFMDEQEGRKRGTWFGHEPVGKVKLGGREGTKFIYEHWDGPFSVRTVAYVVTYRGKYLGLEFRTPDDLYDVQKRILAYFTFLSE